MHLTCDNQENHENSQLKEFTLGSLQILKVHWRSIFLLYEEDRVLPGFILSETVFPLLLMTYLSSQSSENGLFQY